MFGQARDYKISLFPVIAVFLVAGCGGGGSSSGGSSGGPVDTQQILTFQDWTGSYELTEGPAGTDGSGNLTIEFDDLSGDSNFRGSARFAGDGCFAPFGGASGPMSGTIDPDTGDTDLTVNLSSPKVIVSLTGTATSNQIRGRIEASGGPCSDNSDNAAGTWFVNP